MPSEILVRSRRNYLIRMFSYVLGESRAPLFSRSMGDPRAVSETLVHSRRPSYSLGNLHKISANLTSSRRQSDALVNPALNVLLENSPSCRRTSQSRSPPYGLGESHTWKDTLIFSRTHYPLGDPIVNSWRPSYTLIQRLSNAFFVLASNFNSILNMFFSFSL